MITLASHADDDFVARSSLDVQAAHFDIGLASVSAIRASLAGPGQAVDQLVGGLTSGEKRTILLNCVHSGEAGLYDCPQSQKVDRGATVQKVIALPSGSRTGESGFNKANGCPDPIFYRAVKLLAFDVQLFNLNGGCDFVRMSASAARRAGRITALLCSDLSTSFTKRQEIVDSFGGNLDVVVGEPAAVLSLFGLRRIDTLVPKLMRCGTGLVLHRIDFPPIYIRPQSTSVEVGETALSATRFWSQFVPAAFDDLVMPRQRAA